MTTTNFTAIDLSKLPAPSVVEALDYETIYAAMLADLQARMPDFDITLESEPAVILLQVAAWRELMLRQRVNEAARAVMVAYATGTDLDNIAALFGVTRLTITPSSTDGSGNITPAVMESDDEFRARLVLAPEGYSVAGPQGAYIFHSLSADPAVLGAGAASPSPGEVVVTILARAGDGTAPAALCATVLAYLSDQTRRPLTDHVTVQSATIVPYNVVASITTYAGPDSSTVLAAAQTALATYVANSIQLGRDITRAAIYAALMVAGVQNVVITSPASDVIIAGDQSAHCTGITLTSSGVGE